MQFRLPQLPLNCNVQSLINLWNWAAWNMQHYLLSYWHYFGTMRGITAVMRVIGLPITIKMVDIISIFHTHDLPITSILTSPKLCYFSSPFLVLFWHLSRKGQKYWYSFWRPEQHPWQLDCRECSDHPPLNDGLGLFREKHYYWEDLPIHWGDLK
jgi:hypothetical protein